MSRFQFGPPLVTIGDFEGNNALEITTMPSVSFFDLGAGIIQCATLEGSTTLPLATGGSARFNSVQLEFNAEEKVVKSVEAFGSVASCPDAFNR